MVTGRVAIEHGVGWNVAGDHCPGADQRVCADRAAAHDRGIGADARATLHERGLVILRSVSRKRRTWGRDVREDHARATENVVFERHAFVDGDIVLDLDVAADRHPGTDHHILADSTPASDP